MLHDKLAGDDCNLFCEVMWLPACCGLAQMVQKWNYCSI